MKNNAKKPTRKPISNFTLLILCYSALCVVLIYNAFKVPQPLSFLFAFYVVLNSVLFVYILIKLSKHESIVAAMSAELKKYKKNQEKVKQ